MRLRISKEIEANKEEFLNLEIKEVIFMAKYITLEEARDLLELNSEAKEEEIRRKIEKYNFQNNTQYIIYK